MYRRRGSSVVDLLSNITEDIKDFIDDEVIARGRDTEKDLRQAGRNWVDSDDDDDHDDNRSRRSSRDSGRRDNDVDELLHAAITALSKKVNELADAKK